MRDRDEIIKDIKSNIENIYNTMRRIQEEKRIYEERRKRGNCKIYRPHGTLPIFASVCRVWGQCGDRRKNIPECLFSGDCRHRNRCNRQNTKKLITGAL